MREQPKDDVGLKIGGARRRSLVRDKRGANSVSPVRSEVYGNGTRDTDKTSERRKTSLGRWGKSLKNEVGVRSCSAHYNCIILSPSPSRCEHPLLISPGRFSMRTNGDRCLRTLHQAPEESPRTKSQRPRLALEDRLLSALGSASSTYEQPTPSPNAHKHYWKSPRGRVRSAASKAGIVVV